ASACAPSASTPWPAAAPRSPTSPLNSPPPSSPTFSTLPPQPPSTGHARSEQTGHTTPRKSPGPAITNRDEYPYLSRLQAQVSGTVGTLLSTSLDAGVPLRDVQEAASHADPRTTMRYDRARGSLDRHATYIVAAYLAGAAR